MVVMLLLKKKILMTMIRNMMITLPRVGMIDCDHERTVGDEDDPDDCNRYTLACKGTKVTLQEG